MTRRERVIEALKYQETDIIPYQVGFTHQEYDKVASYLKDPNFGEKLGNHIDSVYFDGFLQEEKDHPGYFRDDFGVRWNRNGVDKDIGVIDGFVLQEPDMKRYSMPAFREETLHKLYTEMVNNGKDTFKMGAIGFSMFERAWTLRGMENFLSDMLLEPAFAEELLDTICEFNLQIIDLALSYDIDGFHFGDDWGQQRGLIMGPRLWRQFIKPRMARMYERVKSHGKFVSQHSCGDIHEIFPDLIDIGLDVYQTFQPEIYDIAAIKREYGKHLSFWGGISTQRLLPFATPEEVKKETVQIMKTLGKNGGYIAAPTHDIPGDVPAENVLAMLDVFQHQSSYL
ncbi:MAG: uroporphyrinogen decarboxylase family protein [Clostridia bacterium]|jgi:uroporphyrinogen decarboxylase